MAETDPDNPSSRFEPSDFAPAGDFSDDRPRWEWRSHYNDPRCVRQMWAEGAYLAVLLMIAGAALILVWQGAPESWLDVTPRRYETFQLYSYAILGGALGGTLLSTKWLYHSIARGRWHVDRVAWRLFTPPLSAVFSLALMALLLSGILDLFNQDLLRRPPSIFGLSLVFGYFSDFTIARLYEIAEHLLGSRKAVQEPTGSDENAV